MIQSAISLTLVMASHHGSSGRRRVLDSPHDVVPPVTITTAASTCTETNQEEQSQKNPVREREEQDGRVNLC